MNINFGKIRSVCSSSLVQTPQVQLHSDSCKTWQLIRPTRRPVCRKWGMYSFSATFREGIIQLSSGQHRGTINSIRDDYLSTAALLQCQRGRLLELGIKYNRYRKAIHFKSMSLREENQAADCESGQPFNIAKERS